MTDRPDLLPPARRPVRQAAPGRGSKPGMNGGQAPFIPTDAQRTQIETLVACGFTIDSIAVVTKIPTTTLQTHFEAELRDGKVIVDAKILSSIVTDAIAGDHILRMFYAKARGGWSERLPPIDGAAAAAMFSITIGGPGKPSDNASEIKVSVIPQIEGHAEESEP